MKDIDWSNLSFGYMRTDYNVRCYYRNGQWGKLELSSEETLNIHMAATCLHYGQEAFEGLKAYRRKDGKVQLFRHDANVERLNNSAERIGLPLVPADIAMAAIEQLVEVDQAWVPSAPGTSLYIRPFLFSTDPELSLHGVHQAMFVIILSPSGSYYAEGLNPVKIMLETEDVRAVRGGTGYTKCGGNYAASNRAGDRAMEKGYSQVLWLDGVERKYVEEVGAMNVMFKIDGKVVTPALTAGHHPPLLHPDAEVLGRGGGGAPGVHRRTGGGRSERQAGGGLGHRHRRCHLAHRRAVLQGCEVHRQ